MQTFLPSDSFIASARYLDYKRLGKQRLEAYQIADILLHPDRPTRWRNHPAVRMWEGYVPTLVLYGTIICKEWISRRYKDRMLWRFYHLQDSVGLAVDFPPWLGWEPFHASHRSNLLRKDPDWYGQFGWEEPPNLSYVWPV